MTTEYKFIPYKKETFPPGEMRKRARDFFEWADQRRTVRDFSPEAIPQEVIDDILRTANTAPSGANKQPWTFCVVRDPAVKKQIRIEAEKEEKISYESRMSEEWLEDLMAIGTDWNKPFLETAPALIVVFKRSFETMPDGRKRQNYYVTESVGLACGFLLMAVHNAGLVALTHTPSPMNFLAKVLNRPENEKPFLLIPIGYPADQVTVPDIKRKPLDAIKATY